MKKLLTPMLLCSLIASPLYGRYHYHGHKPSRRTCSPFEKIGMCVLGASVFAGICYGLYHLFHETPDRAYNRCKSFLYKMRKYAQVSHTSHQDVMYEIYSFSNRRYPILTYKDRLDSTITQAQQNLRTIRKWIDELNKEKYDLGSRYCFLIKDFEYLEQEYRALIPDLKSLSGHISSLTQYADERKEKRKDDRQQEKLFWQKQTSYYYPHPKEDTHLHVHL